MLYHKIYALWRTLLSRVICSNVNSYIKWPDISNLGDKNGEGNTCEGKNETGLSWKLFKITNSYKLSEIGFFTMKSCSDGIIWSHITYKSISFYFWEEKECFWFLLGFARFTHTANFTMFGKTELSLNFSVLNQLYVNQSYICHQLGHIHYSFAPSAWLEWHNKGLYWA